MTARSAPASPLDVLWHAPGLITVLLAGEGLALLLALAPVQDADRWLSFGLASLTIQWIALLGLAGLYLLRRPLASLPPTQTAWIALLLLILATWAVFATSRLALGDIQTESSHDWVGSLWRWSAITLTVGMLGLATLQNIWRQRQLAIAAQQAQLAALQARIRPHFLFNTLNTGAALVRAHPEAAEQLLLDLADLFRAALRDQNTTSLDEELDLARRYLEIEKLRFGDRLRVSWRLPESIPEIVLPSLSLQPLVENAIRHGIEPDPAGGSVEIAAYRDRNRFIIEVRNTLPGVTHAATHGNRIGLAATRARIEAISNGRAAVTTQIADRMHVVRIDLPADTGNVPSSAPAATVSTDDQRGTRT